MTKINPETYRCGKCSGNNPHIQKQDQPSEDPQEPVRDPSTQPQTQSTESGQPVTTALDVRAIENQAQQQEEVETPSSSQIESVTDPPTTKEMTANKQCNRPRACGMCKGRLHTSFLRCTWCAMPVHKQPKCAGRDTRYQVDKIDTETYRCKRCTANPSHPRARRTLNMCQQDGQLQDQQTPANPVTQEPHGQTALNPATQTTTTTPTRQQTQGPLEHQTTGSNKCGICKKTIRSGPEGNSNLLRCSQCQNNIHKKEECSRVKKGRIKLTDMRTWACKNCTDPGREHTAKQKCNTCRQFFREGNDKFVCVRCKKGVHKKIECSRLTRDAEKTLDKATWVCPKCMDIEEEEESVGTTANPEGTTLEYVMRKGNKEGKTTVKLLQWNACSLSTKKEELGQVLKEYDIDIFLLQETWIRTKDKLPVYPGYTILPKSRKQAQGNENKIGGGLLIGIRNNIPYFEVKDNEIREKGDNVTEWQTIEIPISQSEKWRITNVYIPRNK